MCNYVHGFVQALLLESFVKFHATALAISHLLENYSLTFFIKKENNYSPEQFKRNNKQLNIRCNFEQIKKIAYMITEQSATVPRNKL